MSERKQQEIRLARRALLSAALAAPAVAVAQTGTGYPTRPVRLVVPNPPGGSADALSRILARDLQERLGQPFVVENRTGSNGIIALDHAAKARPDGYTIVTASVTQFVCNPLVYRSVPYDLDRDFTPIGLVWEYCNVATVPAVHVPARTLTELVAWARGRSGGISYGSYGNATSPHLLGSTFAARHRLDAVHISFRGGGEMVTSMLRGDVHFTIGDLATQLPFIQRGELRAMAVTSPRRWFALPEVPTMSEVGLPELEATIWNGMAIQAGTPPDIVALLARSMAAALATPGVDERVRAAGAVAMVPDPETMRERIAFERPRWAERVRVAGVDPV